ncbi:TPA: HEAT repeat domain-containing protein [bacterium]|nr:HEAT repeat domain-containing protein [bacterium]
MGTENTPRKIVNDSLQKFRESGNPDERLSNLWNISQLIDDTTDEELYELANAVAVEDDPRLRGEICYAISRSRRPNLISIVENMMLDEDKYVREQALSAIREFMKVVDAINDAVKLMNDSRFKEIFSKKVKSNKKKAGNSYNMNDGIILDDRMKNWETYLRSQKELLKEHKGEFVAICNGEILGINENEQKLAKMIHDKCGHIEAFILKIEEDNKEPIEIPPYVGNIVEL